MKVFTYRHLMELLLERHLMRISTEQNIAGLYNGCNWLKPIFMSKSFSEFEITLRRNSRDREGSLNLYIEKQQGSPADARNGHDFHEIIGESCAVNPRAWNMRASRTEYLVRSVDFDSCLEF